MASSEEVEDKIEVVPTTEIDAVQVEEKQGEQEESSNVTEGQWQAIKSTLEFLLGYREEEFVFPSICYQLLS